VIPFAIDGYPTGRPVPPWIPRPRGWGRSADAWIDALTSAALRLARRPLSVTRKRRRPASRLSAKKCFSERLNNCHAPTRGCRPGRPSGYATYLSGASRPDPACDHSPKQSRYARLTMARSPARRWRRTNAVVARERESSGEGPSGRGRAQPPAVGGGRRDSGTRFPCAHRPRPRRASDVGQA
jgi:hypothetical protein